MTARVDPSRSAVLLLDMHNDVVDPSGAFAPEVAYQPSVTSAVSNAGRLAGWARSTGLPVIHVAVTFRARHPEVDQRVPLLRAVKQADALVAGSWGAEFHSSVAPEPGDWVVNKTGIDALANNDLVKLLRASKRDTVLLAGVQTNAVVLATAFTAVDHGLVSVIVEDACAGRDQTAHDAALMLSSIVAERTTTDQIVGEG